MTVAAEPRVEGVEETNASLTKLGEAAKNDIAPASKVAQLAASLAGSFVHSRSGDLSSSYTVQDRYVVSSLWYSSFVELGTQNMEAQYPVQRALETVNEQARAIYEEYMKQQAEAAGFESTG